MRDRGGGGQRRREILNIEFIEKRSVDGIADVVAGQHDVGEITAGVFQHVA